MRKYYCGRENKQKLSAYGNCKGTHSASHCLKNSLKGYVYSRENKAYRNNVDRAYAERLRFSGKPENFRKGNSKYFKYQAPCQHNYCRK